MKVDEKGHGLLEGAAEEHKVMVELVFLLFGGVLVENLVQFSEGEIGTGVVGSQVVKDFDDEFLFVVFGEETGVGLSID